MVQLMPSRMEFVRSSAHDVSHSKEIIPPMFGSCEDLRRGQRDKPIGRREGSTHLITSRILASMDSLSLLCFTDTMRGGSICERGFQRDR